MPRGTRSSNVAVLSLRSDKTYHGLAPDNHLSDGSLQLVHVKAVSRLQFIRFLLHVAIPSWNQFNLPFVEKVSCSHVRIALEPGDHYLNVDGEAIATDCMDIDVLPAAIVLFARGVELSNVGLTSPLVGKGTTHTSYGASASEDEADSAPLLA